MSQLSDSQNTHTHPYAHEYYSVASVGVLKGSWLAQQPEGQE